MKKTVAQLPNNTWNDLRCNGSYNVQFFMDHSKCGLVFCFVCETRQTNRADRKDFKNNDFLTPTHIFS